MLTKFNHQMKKVGVVLLNWNNFDETSECLRYLQKSEYANVATYCIDNGSTDDSVSKLRQSNFNCKIIELNENLGFAGGCNVGIQRALDEGAQYILLINSDIRLEEMTISEMVESAETYDAGITGSILKSPNSELQYAGGRINTITIDTKHITEVQRQSPYPTEYVTGALMLIKSECIEEYGMLNESYFFGFEDVEICWWARKNDWPVIVTPHANAIHKLGATAGRINQFRHYHSTKGRLLFASQLPIGKRVISYIYLILGRLVRFLQWFPDTDLIYADLIAFHDYLVGGPPRTPNWFG